MQYGFRTSARLKAGLKFMKVTMMNDKPKSNFYSILIEKILVWQKKFWKYNAPLAFCSAILLFLPDFFLHIFAHAPILPEPLFFLYIFLFLFLLSLTPLWCYLFFIVIFFMMELVEVNFTAYFGHPITPSDIVNIVKEKTDVFDIAYLRQTWFVFPSLIFCYGLILYMLMKTKSKTVKCFLAVFVVFYLAAHKPMHALQKTKNVWYFQPGPTRYTLNNAINTFSYFFFRYLSEVGETFSVSYQPYEVTYTGSDNQNVLLVWGESLYSKHIPFFGYERNTFPLLSQNLKKYPNVQITQVLSSGIATATSTALFFNLIREPKNLEELFKKSSNLFHQAHQNGYETYYISHQESRLAMELDVQSIDHIINNDTAPLIFKKYYDEGLLYFLKKIDLKKGKKFIVLHMRAPHSPYEKAYKDKPEFEKWPAHQTTDDRLTYDTNTYDNALSYVDYVLNGLVEWFETQTKGQKSVMFITADHGQLFNYQGMWGHNNLTMEQSMVPGIVIGNINKDLPKYTPAYEFGKVILSSLGSSLFNPNEENNTYYLHGNNVEFPYDFIEYKIENDTIIPKDIQNTQNLLKK